MGAPSPRHKLWAVKNLGLTAKLIATFLFQAFVFYANGVKQNSPVQVADAAATLPSASTVLMATAIGHSDECPRIAINVMIILGLVAGRRGPR